MNKKAKTYILLTIVIGIWGTIGYKIYDALNPREEPITTSNTMVSFAPKEAIEKDTFDISNEHYDPFLNKPYREKQLFSKVKKSNKSDKNIVFPSITYRGVISKKRSADNVYILEINGTQQLFKLRKQIEGVKLIRGNKKSVVVTFKGIQKEIPIQ